MDSYNQFRYAHDSGVNTKSASKVYINPNFQRNHTVIPQNGSFYVNPQFNHPNLLHSSVSRPKIHINPNFVRARSSIPLVSNHYLVSDGKTITSASSSSSYYGIPHDSISKVGTNPSVIDSYTASTSGTPANIYVNSGKRSVTSTNTFHLPNVTPNILTQSTKQPVAVAFAKTRYSLVRHNNSGVKKIEGQNIDNVVTKVKISKYKTVSIDHAKKLQTEKDKLIFKTMPQQNIPVAKKLIRAEFMHSRFKLIKENIGTTSMKLESRTLNKRKHSLNSSKLLLKSNQKLRIRVGMAKFKKNNIPCPLFRKYGTCLRNSRGKCEYLHDKKHVSICRRFLKGICHDKMCLLSHEITAEKMPTCSFYLKGMCTKEDCPYLHVKLNEKTKICLDFLKGYCEKGDKCLNRHVNICPDHAMKGMCSRKLCPYPHKPTKKLIVNKIKKLNQRTKLKTNFNKKSDKKSEAEQSPHVVESDKGKDCRYYKEVLEDGSHVQVEMIKPTRCKIGALPSFIQL